MSEVADSPEAPGSVPDGADGAGDPSGAAEASKAAPGLLARAVAKLGVFVELVKFEHSIFALPYAYIGALYGAAAVPVLALETFPVQLRPGTPYVTMSGWPTWASIGWITLAMVGARSFAFVINRAVDAEVDARNPRTAGRAVPAGLVNRVELWLFAAVVFVVFMIAVFNLEPVCRVLWPFVVVPFVVYPYLKRFTWLCHYWLGLCLGLAPVGAWVAVTGDLSNPAPWVFGLAVLLWTAGFDIIYALQDVECDKRDGLHSAPADFGISAALVQTRMVHAVTWILLLVAGALAHAGWPYYAGVVVAGGLLAYENSLVKADDLSRVNAAFFTMNGIIAMVVLLGALVDRLVAIGLM